MDVTPKLFIWISATLFVVSLALALGMKPWDTVVTPTGVSIAPNNLAGFAALGFSISGGLSLIAAGLGVRTSAPEK